MVLIGKDRRHLSQLPQALNPIDPAIRVISNFWPEAPAHPVGLTNTPGYRPSIDHAVQTTAIGTTAKILVSPVIVPCWKPYDLAHGRGSHEKAKRKVDYIAEIGRFHLAPSYGGSRLEPVRPVAAVSD